MKILFAIHQFDNPSAGGTEVYTAALARTLSSKHEVGVLYGSAGKEPGSASPWAGISLFPVFEAEAVPDPFLENYEGKARRQEIERIISDFSPDLLHIQHLSGLGAGLLEAAAGKVSRILMTLGDYWPFCPRGQMIRDDLENCEAPEVSRCASCLFVEPAMRNLEGSTRRLAGPFASALPQVEGFGASKLRLAAAGLLSRIGGEVAPTLKEYREHVTKRLSRMEDILSLVDLFLAPSRFLLERYARLGIPWSKLRHLDYGFEPLPAVLRKARALPLRLGFIGTLIPSKGAHVAAQALRHLTPKTAELHLWGEFAPYHGDVSYKDAMMKALSGLPHEFHGPVPHDRVGEAFEGMDALVVPSLWAENSPLVIHEALQAGVPVLASRAGGIPELVRDGETGLLFETGNARDLALKIQRLASGDVQFSDPIGWRGAVELLDEHVRKLERFYLGME